jgi:acetyl-CoA carboxylase carboxyltransferase component
MAVHGPELEKYRSANKPVPEELQRKVERTRADYEKWLDAFHAASRGFVDALIDPLETRAVVSFALEAAGAAGHREHLPLETI